jgi:CRP-like cAMP-binding protein
MLPKLESPSNKRKIIGKLDLDHLQLKQDFDMDFGNQVATLGPGSIFGELALLHEQPRNASITCSEDCELVVIKKDDFDALLKQEIKRAKHEKMNFLQAHCPGCKRLAKLRGRKINTVMYSFEKTTVPKGHTFFKQDNVTPVGVYLVSSGSVELRSKTTSAVSSPGLYKPKTCNLSVLLKGAAFGCSLPGMPESFSAVATSSCEVYYCTGADFLRLPRSIQQAIQDNLIETMLWRVENSKQDMAFDASISSPGGSRPSTPSRSRPVSGRHCVPPERDVSVSKFPGSRPSTPTRSTFADVRRGSCQGSDLHEQASRAGVVARTRSVIAESRLLRSPSLPAEPIRTIRSSPPLAGISRSCVLRDARMKPAAHDRSLKNLATDSCTKEGSHSFNLAFERCKAFGGHRLRAVRKDFGSTSMSLIDQADCFRR